MSNDQSTNESDNSNPLFRAVVQLISVAVASIWAVAFVSFLAAVANQSGPHSGLGVLGPLARLLWLTPVFVLFVLPALAFSFGGGPSGPKVGLLFLLGGLGLAVGMALLFNLKLFSW
jgi:hypothetical protein